MKIYGDKRSGNCYKIILVCNLLDIDYQWIDVDILKKETQSDEFLAKNPNGKIPILELADGRVLSESNAIMNYLAIDTKLMPKDNFELAKLWQWQFFEQYSHEPNLAVARFIKLYLKMPEKLTKKYQSCIQKGYQALDVMENQLKQTHFLVGANLTNADISLYPYTKLSIEAGFDLSGYLAIQTWFERIESNKNYTPI